MTEGSTVIKMSPDRRCAAVGTITGYDNSWVIVRWTDGRETSEQERDLIPARPVTPEYRVVAKQSQGTVMYATGDPKAADVGCAVVKQLDPSAHVEIRWNTEWVRL